MATPFRSSLVLLGLISLLSSGLVLGQKLDGGFACSLKAFTPEQRVAHDALTRRLFGAVLARREISAGFEFRVDASKMSILDLAAWMDGERRCCPFLALAIEKEPHDGPLWLRLTGPEGVKDFLLSEMDSTR